MEKNENNKLCSSDLLDTAGSLSPLESLLDFATHLLAHGALHPVDLPDHHH